MDWCERRQRTALDGRSALFGVPADAGDLGVVEEEALVELVPAELDEDVALDQLGQDVRG